MINYNARYTNIPGADYPCHFEVVDLITHTEDELLQETAKRTGVPYAVLKAAWLGIKDVWGDWTQAGEGITTDLLHGSPSIKGGAPSIDALFNAAVNSLQYNITAGPYLKKRMAMAVTEKAASSGRGPVITGVEDIPRRVFNSTIAPNYNVRIVGDRLKLDPLGEPSVIYLRALAPSGATYPIEPEDIVVNKPKEIVFRCPYIATGMYELSVTTAYSGTKQPLKTPYTTIFGIHLRAVTYTSGDKDRIDEGGSPDAPPPVGGEPGSVEGAGI